MNEHYKRLKPQTIERLQSVLTASEFQGFCRGNVIKYAERAGYKEKEEREVLKIIDYAKWWYESLNGKKIDLKEDTVKKEKVSKGTVERGERGFEAVAEDYRTREEEPSLPRRETEDSAGYDFRSPIAFELPAFTAIKIYTDVKAYMQRDEVLKIYPRSSLAIEENIVLRNGVGVVDADYYENIANDGNIIIALYNDGRETRKIIKGERIAQGIFEKYLKSDDEVEEERTGGLGSTGR